MLFCCQLPINCTRPDYIGTLCCTATIIRNYPSHFLIPETGVSREHFAWAAHYPLPDADDWTVPSPSSQLSSLQHRDITLHSTRPTPSHSLPFTTLHYTTHTNHSHSSQLSFLKRPFASLPPRVCCGLSSSQHHPLLLHAAHWSLIILLPVKASTCRPLHLTTLLLLLLSRANEGKQKCKRAWWEVSTEATKRQPLRQRLSRRLLRGDLASLCLIHGSRKPASSRHP